MRLSRSDQVARGEAELAKQVARGRAAQVSPKFAYAKHPRSKPGNKGSNEFSWHSQTHSHARRAENIFFHW